MCVCGRRGGEQRFSRRRWENGVYARPRRRTLTRVLARMCAPRAKPCALAACRLFGELRRVRLNFARDREKKTHQLYVFLNAQRRIPEATRDRGGSDIRALSTFQPRFTVRLQATTTVTEPQRASGCAAPPPEANNVQQHFQRAKTPHPSHPPPIPGCEFIDNPFVV